VFIISTQKMELSGQRVIFAPIFNFLCILTYKTSQCPAVCNCYTVWVNLAGWDKWRHLIRGSRCTEIFDQAKVTHISSQRKHRISPVPSKVSGI
jgi:hypothetical protein